MFSHKNLKEKTIRYTKSDFLITLIIEYIDVLFYKQGKY